MTSYEGNIPFLTKKTNADTRSKTSLYGIPFTLVWQPVKSLGRDKKNLSKHENFGLIQECDRARSNFLTGLWLGRPSSRCCIFSNKFHSSVSNARMKLQPRLRGPHVCLTVGNTANRIRIHVTCFSNFCRTTLNVSRTQAEPHNDLLLCFITTSWMLDELKQMFIISNKLNQHFIRHAAPVVYTPIHYSLQDLIVNKTNRLS